MNPTHPGGAGGVRFDGAEPHHFQADCDEPGYRPHCRHCGLERPRHPYHRDVPRRGAR